jgi:hypothetical protein
MSRRFTEAEIAEAPTRQPDGLAVPRLEANGHFGR